MGYSKMGVIAFAAVVIQHTAAQMTNMMGSSNVQCSTISTQGSICDATPWCAKVSTGTNTWACVPNVTCANIGTQTECEAAASCMYGVGPTNNGPQCDAYDTTTQQYTTDRRCYYGMFSSNGQSSTGFADASDNTCLAANASAFMGNLYQIQGFSAGRTSISDGGHDMYDTGNTMTVQALPVRPGNTCFSSSAASYMGNLFSISGIFPGATSIGDGGNDMYDGGNYLRIRGTSTSSNLRYTACGDWRPSGVNDIQYTTCWANGYFTARFKSATNRITGFYVSGNLGADGSGNVAGGSLGSSSGWYGFYKSVDDRRHGDPTVNHVVAVRRSGWRQSYSSSTNSDSHSLTGSGTNELFYVMYGDPPAESRHSRTLFLRLFANVVSGCLATQRPVTSRALPYTTCTGASQAGVGDVSYTTCNANGYVVSTFLSPGAAMVGFRIGGDLGADGSGTVANGALPAVGNWRGFYKTVDDGRAGDPTVNHLILVYSEAQGTWTQSVSRSTNDDTDNVAGTTAPASKLVYILYSDPPSDSAHSRTHFIQLMNAYINGCAPPGNDCFADSASSFMPALYNVSGIYTGSTSIGDGGNDMYDGGNMISVTYNATRNTGGVGWSTNNNCFIGRVSSFMGNLYPISGINVGSNSISDGGNDMYDGGNYMYISTRRGTPGALRYTSCGRFTSAGTADVQYMTCWSGRYFVAVFKSATSQITSFRISGNLGADGSGNAIAASLGASDDGSFYGFYKSVDDRRNGDPTVNHLMMVNQPGWRQYYSTYTNSDHSQITGSGASELVYVLYADPPAESRHSTALFSRLFNGIVSGCLGGLGTTSPALPYTACGDQDNTVGDATYSTCVSDRYFSARVQSATSGLTRFSISGNLGASGAGTFSHGSIGRSTNGLWYGFYKTVHDGQVRDPTVNHLMLVNANGWSQSVGTTTDSDSDIISGPGASMILYIMFSTPPSGTSPDQSVFTQLMNAVSDGCSGSTFQSNVMFSNPAECTAAPGCRWNQNGQAPLSTCATYVAPPPPPPFNPPPRVICAIIPGGPLCAGTDWCVNNRINSSYVECVPNVTCSTLGSFQECLSAASCNMGQEPVYSGPQCDGWTGSSYFQSSDCFFGRFETSNTQQGADAADGNSCMAQNASAYMPLLWDIADFTPDATMIGDGGHDMYDNGNIMQVSGLEPQTGNACISRSAASYMGNLHNILGVNVGSTSIGDGGNDMYDGGNYLRIRTSSGTSGSLRYTQCGAWRSAGVGDVEYYTCWQNRYFRASFRSNSNAITGFYVSGNLGADGGGRTTGGSLGLATGGGYYGFYKSVDDRRNGDPTVNHVMIVPANGWRQSYSTNTNSDSDSITGSTGVGTLDYVLYGDPPAESQHSSTVFRRFFNSIVSGCLRSMQTTVSPPLPYRACGAPGLAGVADITYSTCQSHGYIVTDLFSPLGRLGGFKIDGFLGADGQGSVSGGQLPSFSGWLGFYKTVHDGQIGDAEVNHLVLVKATTGWRQTYPQTTRNDTNVFIGGTTTQIKYILFANPPSSSGNNATLFTRLMVSAISGCAPPGNDCFATAAGRFMGTNYLISGIAPGRTSISDGGNDMYDGGNIMRVTDNSTARPFSWGTNNNCFSVPAASFMNGGRGLWPISGVYTGWNYISDGGWDMYDGGNRLYIRSPVGQAGALTYTGCGNVRAANTADIMYQTCWSGRYFVATFTSATSSIRGFQVSGNLGADGSGNVVGGALGVQNGFYGFYKSVDDRRNGDPTVNHLIMVNTAGYQHSYSTNTNSDSDTVTGPGASTLVYVMYGDHPYDSRHPTSLFQALFRTVMNGCFFTGTISPALAYTSCGQTRVAAGDITYSTCWDQRYQTTVFQSPSSAISAFQISGNLGADGSGAVQGGPLGPALGGGWYGFYKTVHDGSGSGDPTVNHLIIIKGSGATWQQQYASSSNDDGDIVSGTDGVSTLIYVLFAAPPSAGSHSVADFTQLMDTIITGCMNSVWQSHVQYSSVDGCNGAVGCQWNQNGSTTRQACMPNAVPPPTEVPTAAPTRAPSQHACAQGGANNCITPSTYCSDNTNTNTPLAGGVGVGRYFCECNTLLGYVHRLNTYECATSAPTTAVPTVPPTNAPTGAPTAAPSMTPTTPSPTTVPTKVPTTVAPTLAAAASSSDGPLESNGGMLLYIIIIAIAIIVGAVIVGVMMRRGAVAEEADSSRANFTNPLYDDGAATGGAQPEYTSTYDDQPADANGGYLDVDGNEDQELYDDPEMHQEEGGDAAYEDDDDAEDF